MEISTQGIELIKELEGYSPNAYICPAGVWTVGYGHTKYVTSDTCVNEEQAESLLLGDLLAVENYINELPVSLSQSQYDALCSFIFNVGRTAFRTSTLLNKIRANPNDVAAIRGEWMRWVYAGGVELPGLRRRRERELELYFSTEEV